MIQELEIFTDFFPEEYLNTIEIERQKINEETEILAYLKAITDILERLSLDESAYTTFKKAFSEKELNEIIKSTVRVLYFTLEKNGLLELLNKNILMESKDPIIRAWFVYLYESQLGFDKKYELISTLWEEVENIKTNNNISLILDQLDLLHILNFLAVTRLKSEELLENTEKFNQIINTSNSNNLIIRFYKVNENSKLAFTKIMMGQIEEGKELINQALNEIELFDNSFLKSLVFNVRGFYFSQLGYFEKALQNYQLSAKFAANISTKCRRIMVTNINIGDLYFELGNYSEALKYTQKANKINPNDYFPRLNTAQILSLQGKCNEAINEIEKILEEIPIEKIDSDNLLLIKRIQLESYIELNDFEKATNVIEEAEEMVQKAEAQQYTGYISYFKGQIEARKLNLSSAKKFFLKAIELSDISIDSVGLRIKAEFQLSSILLNSYKFSENKHDLQKAISIMETVIKAAKEQNRKTLLCNALVVYARMLDIQGYEKKTLKNLEEAYQIANEYGLKILSERITEQRKLLKKREGKLSRKEKTTGLLGYLAKFLRSMLTFQGSTQVQELPSKIHGLMVTSDTGLALYSQYYNEKMKADDQLISGLLSAVSTFIMEVFKQESGGSLKSITHENITILIEKLLGDYSLVFFAEKDTSEIRSKLIQLTENVEMVITSQDISLDELEAQNKYEEIMKPILTDFFPKKMIE